MPRFSDLYKELYKREPTDFPPPFNPHIKVGKPYKIKLLTEPRLVQVPYGKKFPVVEIECKGKKYSLYFSLVDMHNRISMLEKEEAAKDGNSDFTLVGRTIIMKRKSPRRFEVKLELEPPHHSY